MALEGKPPKDIASVSPTGSYLASFFMGQTFLPPSPLVVYRKAWTGSPGTRSAWADTGQFPQKDGGNKGRGLNERPKKMLGDTEQKGLLGVAPGHKKTWRYLA
jgi:hypothetical protein